MPRSFLVKTHSSHRVPNYGQLEMQRGRGCRGPQPPLRAQAPAGQEGKRGGRVGVGAPVLGEWRGVSSLRPRPQCWREVCGPSQEKRVGILSSLREVSRPHSLTGLSLYGLACPSQLREPGAPSWGRRFGKGPRDGGGRDGGLPGAAVQGRSILSWVVTTGDAKSGHGLYCAKAQLIQRSASPSSSSSSLSRVSLLLASPYPSGGCPGQAGLRGCNPHPRGSVGRLKSRNQALSSYSLSLLGTGT